MTRFFCMCVSFNILSTASFRYSELCFSKNYNNYEIVKLLRPYYIADCDAVHVKFMFSKKATKFDKIFTVHLTLCSKCQINGEDFVNFCGLLGKY